MPFIPHTKQDIKEMLDTIGVNSINTLFDEIPDDLRLKQLPAITESLTEMELGRLMRQRAASDGDLLCFIGAGAYDHHIPAAVWEITSRGEFLTAYTPYQAEASQGTLQLLYEYQTMMASLMALDVSNASLYEGATALAEAILMAVRSSPKAKLHRILLPLTVHPHYRQVINTIVSQRDIEIIDVPFDMSTGRISVAELDAFSSLEVSALVIPQPNFFGVLEEVDILTDWAHSKNALAIAVVNPLSMALLKPPGQWGKSGADIACGEGQPLGVPLASGGPYYGLLCCKKELVRQLPGRIVGRTVDKEGKQGFVLTLQAREQHIRRAKATSNICTNQGLLVTASTIYMSLMGPEGLRQIAIMCHQNLQCLQEKMQLIEDIELVFHSPSFHECVIRLPMSAETVLLELAKHKIQGGFNISHAFPILGECLLICVTETKTQEDINQFTEILADILKKNHTHKVEKYNASTSQIMEK
ncbi:MAG: aminomethyl-transferring glycine dehydrogenase subunit GcvPA [Gammaproteobacteria bacterium]|nr:aminomethyl-transferring glycine dehydrogenase subunit GcvPA [Gammaproteobacteria bacterium]